MNFDVLNFDVCKWIMIYKNIKINFREYRKKIKYLMIIKLEIKEENK